MTPQQLRLECLKLVKPTDINNFDAAWLVGKAKELEAYVTGDGHAQEAPSKEPAQVASESPDTAAVKRPRHSK